LIRRANLSAEAERRLFDALKRKSIPDIDDLITTHVADPDMAAMLRQLPRLAGGRETLQKARVSFGAAGAALWAGLGTMEHVAQALAQRFPQVEFYFDFCELRGYNYHTGLVFAAYAAGYGQAVAQGGRYDGAGAVFGESRPATGFSLDVKALHRLSAPAIARQQAILAPAEPDVELWRKIQSLREQDVVIQLMPGQARDEVVARCDRQLVRKNGQWRVEKLTDRPA